MKHLLLIIMLLSTVVAWSQSHIRTDSKLDWDMNVFTPNISYPDASFDFYMKRAELKDNSGPKLSYWRTGLFKRDSLAGIITGYDFDLMAEHFEKNKGNTFRHWNRFRMGIYLIVNNYINNLFYTNDPWGLFDAELTVSYLHIPQKMRGDQTLKRRKGYVEVFFSMRSTFDRKAYVGIKPWGAVWLKATYNDQYYGRSLSHRFFGFDAEVLTNSNGYNNGLTKLTKDYYKGLSFVVGAKYDLITASPYINLGIRLQTRNH